MLAGRHRSTAVLIDDNLKGSYWHDDVLKGADPGATTGGGANVLMGMDGD